MMGDFNAKSKKWFCVDKTTSEGKEIEFLTSNFGLDQIIKESTNILPNSFSCIDLIFTSQPYIVMESGVHSSLHPKLSSSDNFCKI